MSQEFVIVKYARENYRKQNFTTNPQNGVHSSYSAHNTHVGEQLGIKDKYVNKEEAEKDCKRMNDCNPCGNYAVCPVIDR